MLQTRITPSKRQALIELFDDPSPLVQTALLLELNRLGDQGKSLLLESEQGSNRILSWHARRLLARLCENNYIDDFVVFINSLHYELETGWLILTRVSYPDLDVAETCLALDALAHRCRELMIEPATPQDRCLVLNRVFFHEQGFRASAPGELSTDSHLLNRILDTKRGTPLTLSLLYSLVALRIGAVLEPVSGPARFIAGCFEGELPFYIDPLERGRVLGIRQLKERATALGQEPSLASLAPTSIRECIWLICRDLAKSYASAGNQPMSDIHRRFLVEFTTTYRNRASRR